MAYTDCRDLYGLYELYTWHKRGGYGLLQSDVIRVRLKNMQAGCNNKLIGCITQKLNRQLGCEKIHSHAPLSCFTGSHICITTCIAFVLTEITPPCNVTSTDAFDYYQDAKRMNCFDTSTDNHSTLEHLE